MESELHRAKAERIERSLAKCSRADFETVIEAALLSAGHWFNLALHDMDFYGPDRDVLHLTKLPQEDYLRIQAVQHDLLHAYDELEELRSPYVRGCEPNGEAAADRALELLATIRRLAVSVQPHGIAMPARANPGAGKPPA
jgi:hypothetical protein